MQLRYLPIGSVCSIDNSSNKYMVIGYKKNSYDFVSVLYPDGYLDGENLIYFNEGQISEIYSLGYKDEYGIMFSKKIDIEEKPVEETQAGDIEEDKSIFEKESVQDLDGNPIDLNSNITDEVEEIKEEPIAEEPTEVVESNDEIQFIKNDSPYIFNSEGLVVAIKPEEKKEETVVEETKEESVSPYVFDENGTIIAVNEPTTEVQAESAVENASPYVFDENGTVIAVNMPSTESKEQEQVQSTSPYVFDENGTVIAVNEPTTETQQEVQEQQVEKVENPKYKFDENGFLVAVE